MAGLDEESRAGVRRLFARRAGPHGGTTTVVEMGGLEDYTADGDRGQPALGASPPGYRSGRWYTPDGTAGRSTWDADPAGRASNGREVRRAATTGPGRRPGAGPPGSPAQVDTCSEALLRETARAADDLHVPAPIHVASPSGVSGDDPPPRPHPDRVAGRTSASWAADPARPRDHRAGTSWANFAGDDVADARAAPACSVSLHRLVFIRRGVVMERFARYLARGRRHVLGTDTSAQSMLESLRLRPSPPRTMARRTEITTARRRLRRRHARRGGGPRPGPTSVGSPSAPRPTCCSGVPTVSRWRRCATRSATSSTTHSRADLAEVVVDGRTLVEDGEVLGADVGALTRGVQRAGERVWSRWSSGDWAGRTLDQVAPQTYAEYDA